MRVLGSGCLDHPPPTLWVRSNLNHTYRRACKLSFVFVRARERTHLILKPTHCFLLVPYHPNTKIGFHSFGPFLNACFPSLITHWWTSKFNIYLQMLILWHHLRLVFHPIMVVLLLYWEYLRLLLSHTALVTQNLEDDIRYPDLFL